MRRPQFSIRALLALMLAVACFFGGVRFERERRQRADEAAALAANKARTIDPPSIYASPSIGSSQARIFEGIEARGRQAAERDGELGTQTKIGHSMPTLRPRMESNAHLARAVRRGGSRRIAVPVP